MIVEGSGDDRTDQVRIVTSPTVDSGTRRAEKSAVDAMYEAQFGGVKADRILSGSIKVSEFIQSETFVSGSAGWYIDGDGNAEFNDVTVRGTVTASTITGSSFETELNNGVRIVMGEAGTSDRIMWEDSGGTTKGSVLANTSGRLRANGPADVQIIGGIPTSTNTGLVVGEFGMTFRGTAVSLSGHGHSANTSKVSTWHGGQSNGADKTGKNLNFADGTHNHTAPDHQHTVTI